MDPSVRLLRYFVSIADHGGFTRAADRLFVSQPALSQQIRKLERDLGYPLFHRDARGARLSREGTALLPVAREVVRAADRFQRDAHRLRGGSSRIVLGFRAQAANELTTSVLAGFAAVRPDVEVVLRQFPLAAVASGLDTGEADVAIVRLPMDLTGLDHLPLVTEGRVGVLPDTHPLAGRAQLSLADLADQPWITTGADDPAWQQYARPPGHVGVAAVVVDTVDEFLQAVLAGRGVALAPESAARFYLRPGIRYVPVVDAEPSVVALAWRPATVDDDPAVAAFVDSVRRSTAHPPL